MISKIHSREDGAVQFGDDNHNYNEEDVVIILKSEAIALVKFLETQWLDRHIEYLDDGVKRLMKGIE